MKKVRKSYEWRERRIPKELFLRTADCPSTLCQCGAIIHNVEFARDL